MQGWTKVPPCPLFWESQPPDLGCNIHRTHYIWILYPTLYNIFGESSSIQTHSYNWANIELHEIAKIYWNKSKFEYIELIRKKILKKLLKNLTRLTIPDIKLLKKKFRRKKRWGNLKNQNADMFSKGIYNFFFTKKKEARWRDFEKTRHAHLFSNKGKLLLSRYTRSLVPMFDKR
jgi:hypothetical protein